MKICPICGFDMTPDPELTIDRWISWSYHLTHHMFPEETTHDTRH